ncbi:MULTISPECIES: methyltransferase domain-containing protein [unclassified Butyrivibrio]|uniref:methyltransferase domain-containing protein n=1 Tax=Butyrivibrio sp. LC3010 TaxID=1280680 RepID=UPI0004086C12|nr:MULTISPECIES: methyltransferase domain-containing protein [unclassified Butyrivibrio]
MMNNEQIVEALKESGMRITRQRMIVADVIADNDGACCKDICCIVRGKGRCKVQQGDVSNLNMNEQYDLATAFETIYFWPGLEKCFSEVNKALKPGGIFMIVNESDGTDKASLQFESIIDGMKCHTVEEIEGALKEAGFSKVKSDHHESKPWITVIAKK